MDNKKWSEEILKHLDPKFKHRWEVYEDILKNSLNTETIWIDCGCGSNNIINSYAGQVRNAVGVDIINPFNKRNYVKADIKNLPFKSDFFDLVTLRFVVEHF